MNLIEEELKLKLSNNQNLIKLVIKNLLWNYLI